MNRQYITYQALAEFITGLDILWYADAIEKATIELGPQGCWYDASHPALGEYRNLAGDVIADSLKRIGIKAAAGCGFADRQKWLNERHAHAIRWLKGIQARL